MQLESVQTYAAQKATEYLSNELKTKVKVNKVKFRLLKYLEFKGLYAEDLSGDTLLSIKSLNVDLFDLSFTKNQFSMSAELIDPVVNMHRQEEDSAFNYQFIIDYFSPDNNSESPDFLIKSDYLRIVGGSFSFHDYHEVDTLEGIDYNHVDVVKVNLLANTIKFKGAYIDAIVEEFSFKSSKDFELLALSTTLKIEPELMSFQSTNIQTFGTELYTDISFTANSFKSYSNFNEEVHISANFNNSLIELSDIAYFVPAMNSYSYKLILDGKVNGTVSNLSSENFELHLNKETYLIGEFDVRGLPNIEETFIFFKASEIHTDAWGLRNLPLKAFDPNFTLEVPKELDRFGEIDFKGNFTGFLTDFVAYGEFKTALGSFGTDISLSQDAGQFYYDGSLKAKQFNLGGLLEQEDLGRISFNLDLDGKGLGIENIEAKAIGEVSALTYKKYQYNQISLNGNFSSKEFNGNLSVRDEYLKLDFSGSINGKTKTLMSYFTLDLQEANLAQLNLFNQEDSLTNIKFNADFDIKGSKLNELDGTVFLNNLQYSDSKQEYKTDSIKLEAGGIGSDRELKLNSSFLDAKLNGKFRLDQLADLIKEDIGQQVPGEDFKLKNIATQDFDYDLYVKNLEPLSKIFLPLLRIDSSTRILGTFDNELNISTLNFNSPSIAYDRWEMQNLELTAGGNDNGLSLSLNSKEFTVASNLNLSDYHLSVALEKGNGKLNTTWQGINDNLEGGQIQLEGKVDSFDLMDFHIRDSYFVLNDSIWEFGENNRIHIHKNEVQIDSLSLGNKVQEILLNGRVSEDRADSLLLQLTSFDLNYISTFLSSDELDLKGRINGMVILRDPYHNRTITSDLDIDDLIINNVDVGKAGLKSYWLKDSTGMLVNAFMGEKGNRLVNISGKVKPGFRKNLLDLDLRLNKLPIVLVQPFIKDILSDIEGDLSGDIKINGTIAKPLLKGDLELNNAGMLVNYLNTYYRLSHKILIRPDFIGFDLMEIKDKDGNIATTTGTIFHQNYSNFNLDIGMEMNNFLALNTDKRDNELFYGSGIVSGNANISGYADQLIFEMDLTAKDGTDFKIPLKDDVTVSENNFLVFTNSPQYDEDSTIQIDLSGIQLNFNLKIDPEVKTTIIFDESIGDVITAKGTGNLKMEINTVGNFNMFGQYELTEGEYLFTLRNIVNKKFKLTPGSRLMWDGDPYQARLEIQAIYNLRASLYDIMPEDSTGRYRRRVPVELILNLGGFLLNPSINFDIKIPGADDIVASRLESILYVNQNNVNEQELNQQVFGLLVLGRFMPPSTGTNTGTASRGAPGMNNGYELLSNQLSNWLSSVSDEVDVGVSYRPGDDISQEELDLSLSTEILNDRLVLDGNFGYISDNQQIQNDRASNFIGEFMAEYKLKRDGRLRIRGFNRSNNNNLVQINSPYTQGVGLFYREEFDRISEVWRRYFRKENTVNNQDQSTN